MPVVTFHSVRRSLGLRREVEGGLSFLGAASRAGVTGVECCGITPACGRCRVTVLEGEANVTPPDALEAEMLARRHFLPGERFGCMAFPLGDVEVEIHE